MLWLLAPVRPGLGPGLRPLARVTLLLYVVTLVIVLVLIAATAPDTGSVHFIMASSALVTVAARLDEFSFMALFRVRAAVLTFGVLHTAGLVLGHEHTQRPLLGL